MKFKQFSLYRKCVYWLNRHWPVLVAKLRFRKMFGRSLDLNNPKDINEKILWLSLFSDISEWSRLADKYAVRQYVEDLGLGQYLIPLLGKWNKVEDIDWDSLPDGFVLKSNNGSGTVKIVTNKANLDLGGGKFSSSRLVGLETISIYNGISLCRHKTLYNSRGVA